MMISSLDSHIVRIFIGAAFCIVVLLSPVLLIAWVTGWASEQLIKLWEEHHDNDK